MVLGIGWVVRLDLGGSVCGFDVGLRGWFPLLLF